MKQITLITTALLTLQFCFGQLSVGTDDLTKTLECTDDGATPIDGDAADTVVNFAYNLNFENFQSNTEVADSANNHVEAWVLNDNGSGTFHYFNDTADDTKDALRFAATANPDNWTKITAKLNNSCTLFSKLNEVSSPVLSFNVSVTARLVTKTAIATGAKRQMKVQLISSAESSIKQAKAFDFTPDEEVADDGIAEFSYQITGSSKGYALTGFNTSTTETRVSVMIQIGKTFLEDGDYLDIQDIEVKYKKNTDNAGLTLNNQSFNSGAYVSIYPNPVEDILNIDTVEELSSAAVYGVTGQLVLSAEGNTDALDLTGLASGIYFVKLTNTSGETVTSKFVKK